MKIEQMAVEKLIPYARNPRRNEGVPVAKVKASLKEYGWQQPIVIDREGVIIVGHTRYQAALELGMKEVPVHIATGLTPAQIKAYRIADNRTGSEATWDYELLSLELDDLKTLDCDLELTGFDAAELAGILLERQDGENDPDAEWQGMPEFDQEDKTAFRTIPVHFKDQEGVDEFARLIAQKITDKPRYVWFPEIEIETYADKRYVSE